MCECQPLQGVERREIVRQIYLGTPPPSKVYLWETLEMLVEWDYRPDCHEYKLFDSKQLHVWTML